MNRCYVHVEGNSDQLRAGKKHASLPSHPDAFTSEDLYMWSTHTGLCTPPPPSRLGWVICFPTPNPPARGHKHGKKKYMKKDVFRAVQVGFPRRWHGWRWVYLVKGGSEQCPDYL